MVSQLTLCKQGFCFRAIVIDPQFVSGYDLLKNARGLKFQASLVQLQHKMFSVFVAEAMERILLLHVTQDLLSKPLDSESSNSHAVNHWFLLIAVACFQHFQAFCLLKGFQNVACFQQIPGNIWRILSQFHLGFTHWVTSKVILIIQIVSMDKCSHSVVVNATVTDYMCSLNGVLQSTVHTMS